ncbi:lysophospholipid acyltransferase family protein [Actinomadura keratinilytica]|jgi:1-acyl-sn-glycerol-3-phosphate acyltransferase|uniref:Lysophospholipid acyltransferase family protein n=1 Tax=Actinomadura keratinilytica TaxID=547461 RepID=A0ABP7YIS9_9ACTN
MSQGYGYSPGWRRLTIVVLRPLLFGLLKRDWRGRGNVPRKGGMILAANHISESDPLALSHFVYESGRYPVFLAKSQLFEVKFIKKVLYGTGQIPVYRDRTDAALALKEAEKALEAGQCLIFFPEGSCTRDPELWPMTGQTGVARMALKTGATIVPVAIWGTHELLPYAKVEKRGLAGTLKKGFHPFPRKKIKVIAGPPVDLSRYQGKPLTKSTLREATDEIMTTIAGLLGELRGQEPPKELYDHHKVLEERRRAAAAAAPEDRSQAPSEARAETRSEARSEARAQAGGPDGAADAGESKEAETA